MSSRDGEERTPEWVKRLWYLISHVDEKQRLSTRHPSLRWLLKWEEKHEKPDGQTRCVQTIHWGLKSAHDLYIFLHKWLKWELLCSTTYPFWPICVTWRSSPYLFLIHLMPCSWGSTMSGQRSQLRRMVAFSTDMRSAGRPSFCQAATSASSISILRGSRVGVTGTGVWCRRNANPRSEQKQTFSAGLNTWLLTKWHNSFKSKINIPLKNAFLAVWLFLEAGSIKVLIAFLFLFPAMDVQLQKFSSREWFFVLWYLYQNQVSTRLPVF